MLVVFSWEHNILRLLYLSESLDTCYISEIVKILKFL